MTRDELFSIMESLEHIGRLLQRQQVKAQAEVQKIKELVKKELDNA